MDSFASFPASSSSPCLCPAPRGTCFTLAEQPTNHSDTPIKRSGNFYTTPPLERWVTFCTTFLGIQINLSQTSPSLKAQNSLPFSVERYFLLLSSSFLPQHAFPPLSHLSIFLPLFLFHWQLHPNSLPQRNDECISCILITAVIDYWISLTDEPTKVVANMEVWMAGPPCTTV